MLFAGQLTKTIVKWVCNKVCRERNLLLIVTSMIPTQFFSVIPAGMRIVGRFFCFGFLALHFEIHSFIQATSRPGKLKPHLFIVKWSPLSNSNSGLWSPLSAAVLAGIYGKTYFPKALCKNLIPLLFFHLCPSDRRAYRSSYATKVACGSKLGEKRRPTE